jgi:hypothetical protein
VAALHKYRVFVMLRAKHPSVSDSDLAEACELPLSWGTPQHGRWFGGGTWDTVYGVCGRCGLIHRAADLEIRQRPFRPVCDTVRVCRYCR